MVRRHGRRGGLNIVDDSNTVTASGGSSPAADTTATDVSKREMEDLEVRLEVDSDPGFDADYKINYNWSREWDDSEGHLNIDLTINWDTDPGAGNDVTFRVIVTST